MRVGIGFDVHRYDDSRPLILGGVTVHGGPGLAGHSDADVLSHAVADAVLGAAALGDIGEHFPDGDPQWENVSSIHLLENVQELIGARNLRVVSIDATLMMEGPKIAPYRDLMRTMISAALAADSDFVSVKATTMEGLGAVGRGEGAACMAVALLTTR